MKNWQEAIERFAQIHPHRNVGLFSEFLPRGYDLMTLSSVHLDLYPYALAAKCFLGMYITLYDDLADHPELFNPKLLHELYNIPFSYSNTKPAWPDKRDQAYIDFAQFLADAMLTELSKTVGFNHYRDIFIFDLMQFHNSNRYYTLLQSQPEVANSVEARLFGPFNMGMVIAGTIDLMASPKFRKDELGQARALFSFAQRFGHICNSQSTLMREVSENTFMNEALLLAKEKTSIHDFSLLLDHVDVGLAVLQEDLARTFSKITVHAELIKSFDAFRYRDQLKKLHALHECFLGII